MRRYAEILSTILVAVYYSGALAYAEKLGGSQTPVGLVSLLCLGLAALLVFHTGTVLILPLHWWCWAYLIVAIFGFSRQENMDAGLNYLNGRISWVVAVVACSMVFANYFGRVQALNAITVVASITSVWNVAAFFVPALNLSSEGRSSGLYLNPNSSGLALVVGMAVTASHLPSERRLPFRLLIGAGVLATFSRTAILAWIIAVAFGYRQSLKEAFSKPMAARGGLLLIVALLIFFVGGELWEPVQRRISEYGLTSRIQFFTEGNLENSSIQTRSGLAESAFEIARNGPLLGQGTGTAATMSTFNDAGGTRNVYLEGAIDFGIIGVFLYIVLPLSAAVGVRKPYPDMAYAYVVVFLFAGWFVQNTIYHLYFMVTLVLIASMRPESVLNLSTDSEQPTTITAPDPVRPSNYA